MAQLWIGSLNSEDPFITAFNRARSALAIHFARCEGLRTEEISNDVFSGVIVTGTVNQLRRLASLLYVSGVGRLIAVAEFPAKAIALRRHPAIDSVYFEPPAAEPSPLASS